MGAAFIGSVLILFLGLAASHWKNENAKDAADEYAATRNEQAKEKADQEIDYSTRWLLVGTVAGIIAILLTILGGTP